VAASAAPSAETIESSGRILGVAIGDTVDAARAILDPLRDPAASYPPDQKELEGRRTYWKLAGTDYDWIMVWAKEGKITRIRAVLRPDRHKPFAAVGDLNTAAARDATSVRWNLRTPAGANYRLVAQGADEVASTVFMFALE
jgi:hypothetical protein